MPTNRFSLNEMASLLCKLARLLMMEGLIPLVQFPTTGLAFVYSPLFSFLSLLLKSMRWNEKSEIKFRDKVMHLFSVSLGDLMHLFSCFQRCGGNYVGELNCYVQSCKPFYNSSPNSVEICWELDG
ncbi:hypothetical protein ABZP36_024764 [Zizania latifolia]